MKDKYTSRMQYLWSEQMVILYAKFGGKCGIYNQQVSNHFWWLYDPTAIGQSVVTWESENFCLSLDPLK